MKEQLDAIKNGAEAELESAGSLADIEELRLKYLGKKGELTSVLRGMGGVAPEERPLVGQMANDVRGFIESGIIAAKDRLQKKERLMRMESDMIDVTVPGKKPRLGSRHTLSIVFDEFTECFIGMGYEIAEGPEIEHDYYNFQALNFPLGHPSRDVQDTFYITDSILLRTHTSPVQVRVMENRKPPIRIICPGRVYRSDEVDATHSPVFHQVEGLVVDKGVTMGDLAGTLKMFAQRIFGESTDIRLRPHYFPFTEPSAEVDVTCWVCKGKGCRTCKQEGWVELLGAGMVNPWVLQNCGIDPEIYSGFAFGIGIDRVALCKFGIDDMRLFFENDVRFLSQF